MGPRNAAESSEGMGQAGISHDGVPLFRAISIWVISLEKWLQEHLEDVQKIEIDLQQLHTAVLWVGVTAVLHFPGM